MPRLTVPARAQLWTERFERLQLSGLTVAQFCSQEAINISSFYQWKKKLAKANVRLTGEASPSPRFVALQVKQPLQVNVAILRLPAGVCIELPASLRQEAIAELIAACIQAAVSVSIPSENTR